MKVNPVSGYVSYDDKSKYPYEISNNASATKCRCGLHSTKITRLPDGREIALHVTMKGAYYHISYPGQPIKRVFKCPDEFEFNT